MIQKRIVLGLLDTSRSIGDRIIADKCRELTIAWSRYGYRDEIIERDTVDGILSTAEEAGYDYCFIQPYGCILSEHWNLYDQTINDFFSLLNAWVQDQDFVVVGSIISKEREWYGFEAGSLLIDLKEYRRQSMPAFEIPAAGQKNLPVARPEVKHGRITKLTPSGDTDLVCPKLWGWNFICSSLRHELPVIAFNDDLQSMILDLEANAPERREALVCYFGWNVSNYSDAKENNLSEDQKRFLHVVSTQTKNAHNGVFLWNIESYADIDKPCDTFSPPVSTLYCVAAGFKPNRILEAHGFDSETKVVFFDYSSQALKIRECLINQWDGEDFPRFVKYLFKKFPSPDTYYQLWGDSTPDDLDWEDVEFAWERELERWGGNARLRDHWRAYQELQHEFIHCNILSHPSQILSKIEDENNAIMWWSNAFFTIYGNWFYSLAHRKQAYDNWIQQLADIAPHLYLFGSDFNNTSVNLIQAAEYWNQYRLSGCDSLRPFNLQQVEIRT